MRLLLDWHFAPWESQVLNLVLGALKLDLLYPPTTAKSAEPNC